MELEPSLLSHGLPLLSHCSHRLGQDLAGSGSCCCLAVMG